MYNNTEEQVFQNFIQSAKGWIPYLIVAICIGVSAFYGYRWYENSQVKAKQEVYISFDQFKTNIDLNTKELLFKKFLENNPKSEFVAYAGIEMASSYIAINDYTKAAEALRLVEQLPGAKFNLDRLNIAQAGIAYQLKNYDVAFSFLNRVAEASPFYDNSQLLYGDILASQDKPIEAISVWKKLKNKISVEANSTEKQNLIQILELRIVTH